MSAKHAVLGLVVEQPSYASRIAAEVRRQLLFADLAASYSYWALEKLKAEGLVQQVHENGAPAGTRRAGGQVIYEATVNGVQAFEDWLRSSPGECSLRDDLLFRLAVARPRDVPTIIELIRSREYVCVAREQALNHVKSVATKERFSCRSVPCDVASDAELMFWRGRIDWLRRIREMLETISPRISREI